MGRKLFVNVRQLNSVSTYTLAILTEFIHSAVCLTKGP